MDKNKTAKDNVLKKMMAMLESRELDELKTHSPKYKNTTDSMNAVELTDEDNHDIDLPEKSTNHDDAINEAAKSELNKSKTPSSFEAQLKTKPRKLGLEEMQADDSDLQSTNNEDEDPQEEEDLKRLMQMYSKKYR